MISEKLPKHERREYVKTAKELKYPPDVIYRLKYEAETYVQAEMILTDARKKMED